MLVTKFDLDCFGHTWLIQQVINSLDIHLTKQTHAIICETFYKIIKQSSERKWVHALKVNYEA